jgi:hypothetical protein
MRLKRDNALRKYWGRSGLKAGRIELRGLAIACPHSEPIRDWSYVGGRQHDRASGTIYIADNC